MLSKIIIVTILLLCLCGLLQGAAPNIDVVYPDSGQIIAAVDSTFIFGNVSPGAALVINGTDIEVHDNGAFLAYLPIQSGEFEFELKAVHLGDTGIVILPVKVPERYIAPDADSVTIVPGFRLPARHLGLMAGDLLELGFRGTPDCHAYARLSNAEGLVPMTEEPPKTQGYWGKALFGGGDVPDSVLVRGSYSGVVTLTDDHVADTVIVTFLLCREAIPVLDSDSQRLVTDTAGCGCVADTNAAPLTVLSGNEVVIGELIDSVQIIRTGPRKGYLSIFQPRGVKFRITGFYGNYLRSQLRPGQDAWMPDSSIRFLPEGARLPRGEVSLVRTESNDDGAKVSFRTGAKLPFRVDEDLANNRIHLDVYNCISNIDWIRYDHSDEVIEMIRWSQPQREVMRLTVDLGEPIWGYDAYYTGDIFNLQLKSIPRFEHELQGIRVVIDPGHSPDPGAIGPTGFMEKDANFFIAEKLMKELRKKRASVILTRGIDEGIGIYDRPQLAYQYQADIFISVHNNALPDGVNPFNNNGSSTYYYHPHSRELAEFIHVNLLEKTELPDFGLYHANFAVARPTGYLAVLVECAFMMIPEQERALQTESFQEEIAEGIANGIIDFVKEQRDRWR